MTDWRAHPDFLPTARSDVVLSGAATDPETDPLVYDWAVEQQPEGAKVKLETPASEVTRASGLSAPGLYVFAVTARDGAHRVTRRVGLRKFAENQPPVILGAHNRLPVTVTTADAKTTLRGAATDVEGDKLTLTWSVVTTPAGANVKLEPEAKGNGMVATGLSEPGDYVFRMEVTDGVNTVRKDHTVTVYRPEQLR
jgi:hypothetical protein